MDNYQHILLVTNCSEEDEVNFTQEFSHFFSQQPSAQLSLIYVIPKIPPYYLQCPASLELEKQLKDKAKACLIRFEKRLAIANIQLYLRAGILQDEVINLAEQLKVDLVLMAKKPKESLLKSLFRKLLHLQPKLLRKKIYMQTLLT